MDLRLSARRQIDRSHRDAMGEWLMTGSATRRPLAGRSAHLEPASHRPVLLWNGVDLSAGHVTRSNRLVDERRQAGQDQLRAVSIVVSGDDADLGSDPATADGAGLEPHSTRADVIAPRNRLAGQVTQYGLSRVPGWPPAPWCSVAERRRTGTLSSETRSRFRSRALMPWLQSRTDADATIDRPT